MSLILVHPPSPGDAGMFDAAADNPGHAPWIGLRNWLRAHGSDISTTWKRPDDLDHAAWVLFMNVPMALRAQPSPVAALVRRVADLIRRRPGPTDRVWERLHQMAKRPRLGLFLWEPDVVLPENFDPALHHHFDRVFTWKRDLSEQGGLYRPIFWPQPSGMPEPANPAFADRKLLVNFSGNKQSSHPLELYSARVEVIRHMEAHHPQSFDHYGFGWGADYPSWRGTADSKFDLYPSYRFGLCFENMHSVRGYVTEKIFDCLQAGTVPVYWGAPDITVDVPAETFIDRRDFTSTADMVDCLLSIDEAQWTAIRDAGRRYVASADFRRFQPEAFSRLLADGLAN